jgi:Uma2 family endonuclease
MTRARRLEMAAYARLAGAHGLSEPQFLPPSTAGTPGSPVNSRHLRGIPFARFLYNRLMSGEDVMKPANPAVKLTYEDYLQFPDDGKRHELIDGEHFVTPTPIRKHQAVAGNLFGMLWNYLQQHRAGRVFAAPFDVILSDADVVEPDLLYLSNQRLSEIETSPWVRGAPDLVVEIGSPGTRRRDETIKRRLYERSGVSEYWVVDPEIDTVKVYRRHGDRFERTAELSAEAGDRLASPLFPDLELPLSKIFED